MTDDICRQSKTIKPFFLFFYLIIMFWLYIQTHSLEIPRRSISSNSFALLQCSSSWRVKEFERVQCKPTKHPPLATSNRRWSSNTRDYILNTLYTDSAENLNFILGLIFRLPEHSMLRFCPLHVARIRYLSRLRVLTLVFQGVKITRAKFV